MSEKSIETNKGAGLLLYSIIVSIVMLLVMLFVGALDTGIVLTLFPDLNNELAIIDKGANEQFLNVISDVTIPISVVIGMGSGIGLDLYRQRKVAEPITWRRFALFVVGFLAGFVVVMALFLVILNITQGTLSIGGIVVLIVVFVVPFTIGYPVYKAWRERNEGLAFNCFGVSLSVVSIYISALFFLLSIIATS